jgi:cytochrome c-type biogenesis protein CcmF
MALAFAVQTGRTALGPVGLALGAWVVFGAATDLWARARRGRLPRADVGKAVAHAGFGFTVFAAAAINAWTVEDIRVAQLGETWRLGAYDITLDAVGEVPGPNFTSTTATMTARKGGSTVAILRPERRVYPVAGMPTTEAAIDYGAFRDLYLVIGDPQDGGGWAVRGYVKPFANWLWAGAALMALGGLLSLSDRRWRVAAGARRAVGVPAE